MLSIGDKERGKVLHGVLVQRATDGDGKKLFTGLLDGVSYWGISQIEVVKSCLSHFGREFRHINKSNLNDGAQSGQSYDDYFKEHLTSTPTAHI